jgi:hypothetical protein
VDNPLNGSYKLWFNLYKENITVDYTVGTDYSGDNETVQSIEEAVRNERQSLNLNMALHPSNFYLLDENGNTSSLPYNVTANQTLAVQLGLANYEGQTMDYQVLVMISNLSVGTLNGTLNVTFEELYYLDTFNDSNWTDVPNLTVAKGDNWTPQLETNYSFSATDIVGPAQVWFILYKDSSPPTFFSTAQNYADDSNAQDIIIDAISGGLQYVTLPLLVSAL